MNEITINAIAKYQKQLKNELKKKKKRLYIDLVEKLILLIIFVENTTIGKIDVVIPVVRKA